MHQDILHVPPVVYTVRSIYTGVKMRNLVSIFDLSRLRGAVISELKTFIGSANYGLLESGGAP